MNPLHQREQLNNRYFTLRHGESVANLQGIIVSSLARGQHNFGLTEKGRRQVDESVRRYIDTINGESRIYSSPFLRAQETAAIAQQILGLDQVTIDERLRERYFGEWDGTSSQNYQRVWEEDQRDSSHNTWGVESFNQVLERMTSFISDREEQFKNNIILIVSHGDPLQMLHSGFQRTNPIIYASCPIQPAEIREFLLK